MNFKKFTFLASLLLCSLMVGDRAEAKDLIFHMGNEMIQVIDADTDAITSIPIKGAARDSVFSADKKFLYVTGTRRNIQKLDLQKMQIVNNIQIEEKAGNASSMDLLSVRTARPVTSMFSPAALKLARRL